MLHTKYFHFLKYLSLWQYIEIENYIGVGILSFPLTEFTILRKLNEFCAFLVRIGSITILRKGKSDLISDGETGSELDDFCNNVFSLYLYINLQTLCLNFTWFFFYGSMSYYFGFEMCFHPLGSIYGQRRQCI